VLQEQLSLNIYLSSTEYRINYRSKLQMNMGQSRSQSLALLPLPKGLVLLPGITLRVPVSNRTDIPALLSSVYTRAATPKPDATAISIGCVPINSSLLSPDGINLIDDIESSSKRSIENHDIDPGAANKKDLFSFGTVARISGVQGRRPDDLALVVEGIRRFRVDTITQKRPFFEANVTYLDEERRCH